ncbi:MAG: hypothetical protein BV457_05690 [Thermoplasmata archaeon M9B1D]|nr:MAG: hypothetical protein BV457_05690 [Thermoplasmata archaeon M9B1D]
MLRWWFRYRQKCNDDIKRNFYYMQYKNVINDGLSEDYMFSVFDILYPIFIISGLSIFMYILTHWTALKEKIRGKDEG